MLQAAAQEAVRLDTDLLAFPAQPLDDHLGVPGDDLPQVGDAQTALLVLNLPVALYDPRVDQHSWRDVLLADVVDEDAERNSDLRRGKADPVRRIHRVEQVVDERTHLRAHLIDGLADLAQGRVAEQADATDAQL